MTTYTLKNENLEIRVKQLGAELSSLKDRQGNELLWQADKKYWPRHAPNLFPIVGRLNEDKLVHQGKTYSLPQHGFARDMEFECIDAEGSYLSMRLRDNEQTIQHYPFQFELLVNYALIDNRLMVLYVVRNYLDQELPFSIGAHPAFKWPLLPDTQPQDYSIVFENPEASEIWQLEDGLIHPALRQSPLKGKTLHLENGLFDHDALIFPDVMSESVFYGDSKQRGIKINYAGFPDLGIWSKPGAPFVCIEPWVGHASPMQFDGEFMEKPGIIILPPHSERSFSFTIEVNT